ncbi:hypothetical protein F5I97DRAFT_1833721 [Phlebopus sp. FC_14]|nr:hypothetical protein F5I97DRAFT_1833721 [Phlebopus sp. FC_14]
MYRSIFMDIYHIRTDGRTEWGWDSVPSAPFPLDLRFSLPFLSSSPRFFGLTSAMMITSKKLSSESSCTYLSLFTTYILFFFFFAFFIFRPLVDVIGDPKFAFAGGSIMHMMVLLPPLFFFFLPVTIYNLSWHLLGLGQRKNLYVLLRILDVQIGMETNGKSLE